MNDIWALGIAGFLSIGVSIFLTIYTQNGDWAILAMFGCLCLFPLISALEEFKKMKKKKGEKQ